MAVAPSTTRYQSLDPDAINDTMRKYFEPQLKKLELGENQIEEQNLEQLWMSLERVNDAIQNPDSFGTFGVSIDTEAGVVIAKQTATSSFQVGILPLLLERKRLILNRIAVMKGEQNFEGLQNLVEQIPDDDIRGELQTEIEELKETSSELRRQIRDVEEAQKEQLQKEMSELEALVRKTEMFERRSKVWLTFLERESVATIVGSILLVIMALALIVAMFLNVPTSEIINNAFLVILGYFFGQTVSRASQDSTSTKA